FVAWGPARLGDDGRAACLDQLRARLSGVFDEPPILLPALADFPQFGIDTKKRFMVVVTRPAGAANEDDRALPPALDPLVRSGFVLDQAFTPSGAQSWRAFLTVRAGSPEEVRAVLTALSGASHLEFEVREIA